MRFSTWLRQTLLSVVAAVAIPHVQAQDACKAKCTPPTPPQGDHYVQIDASKTGVSVIRKFGKDDPVSVLVRNKNPYRYEYKVAIQSRPLAQDIVTDFFSVLRLPDFTAKLPEVPQASGVAGCKDPTALAAIGAFKGSFEPSRLSEAEINQLLELKPIAKRYDDFLTETTGPTVVCEKACSSAVELKSELPKLADLDTTALAAKVKAFDDGDLAAKLKAVETAVDAIANPDQQKDCRSVLDGLRKQFDAEKPRIESARKLHTGKRDFAALLKVLDAVEKDSEAFVQLVPLPMSDRPMNHTVTITRKDRRAEAATEETVASLDIDTGEVPLSVAIGIGFSTIDDIEIIRQAAVEEGTTVNKFGFKSNSSFKPSGVALLHGHLWTRKGMTLGASAGLVASSRGGETEIEYLLGPSVGFKDNLIWLTFGFHAARVEQLGGGFQIGDVVPDDLQDPLPIERNFHKGFMFTLSVKIR